MGDYRHEKRKEKLMALFERHNLRPQIHRGQNFLLDKNQVNFIARTGEAAAGDLILEVGPGTGFLSHELAETGATVLAVEIDRGMAMLARAAMKDYPNFFLIESDILDGKSGISPVVLARIQEMLDARPGRLKCIANLPYSAGTPFAANVFESPLPWHSAAYLLQYEVGQRLVAQPGTQAYGSLSIKAALGGKVKIARKVPPTVFWPRPKVDSAVIKIVFNSAEERMKIPWRPLRLLCVAVFNSRRKSIRNALKGIVEKHEVLGFLEEAGVDPDKRGQDVPPEKFLRMAELFKARNYALIDPDTLDPDAAAPSSDSADACDSTSADAPATFQRRVKKNKYPRRPEADEVETPQPADDSSAIE